MIRGIWMWPNNIHAFGTEKIVSVLKSAGFTDIYFLTKGLSGKTSFLSRFAPHAYERDLLRELLSSAHAYGLRVHAWFTSASDEYYKSVYPECGRAHFKRGKDRGLISLKHEGYMKYLKNIIDEVAENYPVDGIHLDYIRYNHMLYGWDDDDIRSYESFGADRNELFSLIEDAFFKCQGNHTHRIFELYKDGNASLMAFYQSRKADVLRFAERMLSSLRSSRPDLILSAAVMPESAYADTSFSDLHYGQVLTELSPLFDYLVPMAYSGAYEKTSEWIEDISYNLIQKDIPFVCGIQAYDNVSGMVTQSDVLAALRSSPKGYAVFKEGSSAITYKDNVFHLFNGTTEPITRIEILLNGQKELKNVNVLPNEAFDFSFEFCPSHILAYSGLKNVSVFYDKMSFV